MNVIQVIDIVTNAGKRQYEYQMNTGIYQMKQGTCDFSPEIHVLASALVAVVSTTHLVVRRIIGISQT